MGGADCRLHARFSNDIVIAQQPDKPSVFICKRITAMPGDDVPPDVTSPCKYNTNLRGEEGDFSWHITCELTCDMPGEIPFLSSQVPRGHVWVEGDNPRSSYDSRDFGPLPQALIHSRVFFRVWPLSQFGVLK